MEINKQQAPLFQVSHVFEIFIFTTRNCSERVKVSAFSKLNRTRLILAAANELVHVFLLFR